MEVSMVSRAMLENMLAQRDAQMHAAEVRGGEQRQEMNMIKTTIVTMQGRMEELERRHTVVHGVAP